MSGGTISGNAAFRGRDGGGGVLVTGDGSFIMDGGTISDNRAVACKGGGVSVKTGGSLVKTGGTIYGDTDNAHTTGANENTSTSGNTNGHAVYYVDAVNKYRDSDLPDDATGNISTSLDTGWNQ